MSKLNLNMRSSYHSNLDYSDIFQVVCFLQKPKLVVEFGLLDGFSLQALIESNAPDTTIQAFDIFDDFNGNHANQEKITQRFSQYPNVSIAYGDFYSKVDSFQDQSIDLLHIDIANNGEVFEFVFQKYLSKISPHGIILLEGGSVERDRVEWMQKFNKPKVRPVLDKYQNQLEITTIGQVPSLTLIQRKLS